MYLDFWFKVVLYWWVYYRSEFWFYVDVWHLYIRSKIRIKCNFGYGEVWIQYCMNLWNFDLGYIYVRVDGCVNLWNFNLGNRYWDIEFRSKISYYVRYLNLRNVYWRVNGYLLILDVNVRVWHIYGYLMFFYSLLLYFSSYIIERFFQFLVTWSDKYIYSIL